MWYLNFCLPIDNLYEVNRKFMLTNLVLLILVYFYIKFNSLILGKDRLSDEDYRDKIIVEKDRPVLFNKRKLKLVAKTYTYSDTPKTSFFKAISCFLAMRLQTAEIDQQFALIFGEHAVCNLFASMYSPFWGQVLVTYFYTILVCLLIGLRNNEWYKTGYVVQGLMGISNLFLLNSGFYYLAQYNWDSVNVNCYFQQLQN